MPQADDSDALKALFDWDEVARVAKEQGGQGVPFDEVLTRLEALATCDAK